MAPAGVRQPEVQAGRRLQAWEAESLPRGIVVIKKRASLTLNLLSVWRPSPGLLEEREREKG